MPVRFLTATKEKKVDETAPAAPAERKYALGTTATDKHTQQQHRQHQQQQQQSKSDRPRLLILLRFYTSAYERASISLLY
jgi:hypothetical protein